MALRVDLPAGRMVKSLFVCPLGRVLGRLGLSPLDGIGTEVVFHHIELGHGRERSGLGRRRAERRSEGYRSAFPAPGFALELF